LLIIASYLPENEGHLIRELAGNVIFRHEDLNGYTYKNGALHSFDDLPAIDEPNYKVWYKDGVIHREGDLPAVIESGWLDWFINGKRHREDGKHAVIGGDYKGWYIHGELQRQTKNDMQITNQFEFI